MQNGIITSSSNISAGVYIYATDGFIKQFEIMSTSTFTGSVTVSSVQIPLKEYSNSSGLVTLKNKKYTM